MRLISWNCQGGFHNEKYMKLAELSPDIAIVQEYDKRTKLEEGIDYQDLIWQGKENKGIAVMTFTPEYKLTSLVDEVKYPWIVPILVSGKENFVLIAVWTQKIPGLSYGKLIKNALEDYSLLLKDRSVIIMGDFNIDQKHRPSYSGIKFNEIIDMLDSIKIKSCYHHFNKEEFGLESKPTYFHNRKSNMPFHLDYCFASGEVIDLVSQFYIADGNEWLGASDHLPLILETIN